MPGTCIHSAKNIRTNYQRFFDALQINNRASFDRAVKDGWYANAIATSMRLKANDGHKIMADFEKVSLDLLNKPNGVENLKDYITFYSQPEEFWTVLKDYRKRFKSGLYSPTEMEKIIKTLAPDVQTKLLGQRNLLKKALDTNVQKGTYTKALSELEDADRAAMNRFIDYARSKEILEPFMEFFKMEPDKVSYITKVMTNDVYLGFLKQIHEGGKTEEIISVLKARMPETQQYTITPNHIVREYTQGLLEKTFPELKQGMKDPSDIKELYERYQKLYNEFLLTGGNDAVKDGKTMHFLKGVLMNTRIISSMSKFTLGGVSGVLMLGQNFFTNFIQHKGITKGIGPELRGHKLIDYLANNNLLSSIPEYEDYRKLIIGSGRQTYAEKLYEATLHKAAYWVAGKMPGEKLKKGVQWVADTTKDATLTGLHNIQDHVMAGPHLRAGIAQAALDIFGDDPKMWDKALDAMQKGTLPEVTYNKFLVRAEELARSGNNAFSFEMLQKHMLSDGPWSVVSYLQGYHMQRIGEMTAGFKKFADAVALGEVDLKNWTSVREHLWTTNPELRKFLMINLDTVHLGFYLNHFYDDEDNNEPQDYAKLYNEYLNSYGASFFGRMATNFLGAFQAVEVYEDATGKQVPMIQGIPVAALDFINSLFPMMYREFDVYKIVPRMMDAFKVNDPQLFATLRKEALDTALNGNYRFNMPEGENTFGQIAMPERDDIIGSLLLGMHTTNRSIALADNLYEVGRVDRIIQGKDENEEEDSWLYKTWKALPFIDTYYAGNVSKTAEWKALSSLRETDPVLKALYAGDQDIFNKYISQYDPSTELYKTEIQEFYKDLTSFNYPQWNATSHEGTRKADFYIDKMDSLAKEELFTTLLEQKLGKEYTDELQATIQNEIDIGHEVLRDTMGAAPTMEHAAFQKMLILAEKSTPGSGKVVVAYMANKLWYEWAKENAPKGMSGYADIGKADTDPRSIEKKREILEMYYPYLYLADKTSYLKVVQNQVKNQHPEVFKDISSSQRALLNTLTLTDFVAHREALSGQPSAGNISNVMNTGTKYIKDPIDRLAVINYTVRGIEQLDIPRDDKDMAIMGVYHTNVEMLTNLAKDPEAMELHGEQVTETIDNLFGAIDRAAVQGGNIHALTEKDFDDEAAAKSPEKKELMSNLMSDYKKSSSSGKTAYQAYTKKPYVQKPYNKTNSYIQDKVSKAANKDGYEGLRQYYTPSSNGYSNRNAAYTARSMSGSPAANYAIPRPKILDAYYKLARSEGVASITSPALLKQTVKRNLESENGGYRQPQSSGYKKQIAPQQRSVKAIRTANIKKRGPNVQLPLGLINIG